MRTLINVFVIVLITQGAVYAQGTGPARIHFFNASSGAHTFRLQTSKDAKPILVKSRAWVILETRSDSLPLLMDENTYQLPVEPGKSYYFVVQAGYVSYPVVTEKSEREFSLTTIISTTRGPEIYQIDPVKR